MTRSPGGRSRCGPVLTVAPTVAAVAALLALAACRSGVDRANAYEATYDQQFAQGNYPAALQSIQRAVAADEDQPGRWLKLARVQGALDRPAAASQSYQRALDLQPDSIEAMEALAVLAVRAGQYDIAKRMVDPLLLLQPNDLPGLIARAAIALRERRFTDAEQDAATIIAGAPSREDGYVIRARILDATGKPREAIALLEQRAAHASDNPDVLLLLLSLYQKQGDRPGIQATAIRLMPLFPDDPRYAMESARAYHARGQEDNVRIVLDRLRRRYAGNPSLMRAIAQFWRSTAPPAVARAEIAKLAADSPPRVRFALADMLVEMGDANGAIALLAGSAPATVTSANIDGQTHYARALLAGGRTAEARAKVDAVLAFDPGNADGLLLRARLAFARKDYAAAATDAQLVANDDVDNEEAALLVARSYAAQNNVVLAEKAYAQARTGFPDSTRALIEQAQWLIGQDKQAIAARNAASFARAHDNVAGAWQAMRDICTAAGDSACAAEARARLAGFTGRAA